jgi:uncharacterized protein YcbX
VTRTHASPHGFIDALYHYPIKGFSPQQLESVTLQAGRGFPHDRRYALARRDGHYMPGARQLLGKRDFHMLMKDERLAEVRSVYSPEADRLELFAAGGTEPVLTVDLSTAAGREAFTRHIGALLGLPPERLPVFALEDGRRVPDLLRSGEREMQAVSVINRASVRELGRRAGVDVDPLRFRANLYLEGLPPFAERSLVGATLACGDVRLKVFQEIARCAATEVNLDTARRDVPVLRLLHEYFGHTNMGVYAHVFAGGLLEPGTRVSVEATGA